MHWETIIAASIGLGVPVIAGIFALINTRLRKKMEAVMLKVEENDKIEIENNILSMLVPVLEHKDLALDRMADIIEEAVKLRDLRDQQVNMRLDVVTEICKTKCEAPKILVEILKLQECEERKEERRAYVKALIQHNEHDKENDTI